MLKARGSKGNVLFLLVFLFLSGYKRGNNYIRFLRVPGGTYKKATEANLKLQEFKYQS